MSIILNSKFHGSLLEMFSFEFFQIGQGVVTLGQSSDFQTIDWRFPETNICPISECGLSCLNRTFALNHFQLYHAATSMACTICEQVFSVTNPLNILRHHQFQHPNDRTPQLKSVGQSVGVNTN